MSEEIGRHKGAVETLLHEKKELSRLLQIVNGQLKRHLQALEENGVDAEEFMEQLQEEGEKRQQESRQRRQSQGRQSRQQGQQNSRGRRSSESRESENRSNDDEEFDLGNHLE